MTPFGKELPQQAVGVFIRAALPRSIRLGEVDVETQPSRETRVLGELFAVVERGGPPSHVSNVIACCGEPQRVCATPTSEIGCAKHSWYDLLLHLLNA